MTIDYGNPPRDFIRDNAAVVRCKGCKEWVSIDDNRCACNVQCCETCGSACVRFVGDSHRWCTACDAEFLADCAADPACEPLETPGEARRRVLKLEAGTHLAFHGTWMGRVLTAVNPCAFAECAEHFGGEPTQEVAVPSMVELIGGAL